FRPLVRQLAPHHATGAVPHGSRREPKRSGGAKASCHVVSAAGSLAATSPAPVSRVWYPARSAASFSFFGKKKNTRDMPSAPATIAAKYAQSAPSRNDDCAALVICVAYCGYCAARFSALENESSSSLCVV